LPKNEKQKLKLFRLTEILERYTDEEHGLARAEIEEKLRDFGIEAERKSLYDDLLTLGELGYVIEKRRDGRLTRYHLVERRFELPELKLLADAVQSAKFLSEKKRALLLEKLTGFTSVHEASRLHRDIYISDRYRTDNGQVYYAVDAIHTAMAENRQISFLYFEYNEEKRKVYRHDGKRYRVSPWGLIWSDGNYYLVAYDSDFGDFKHYRVDKMESTAILDDLRDGKEAGERLDLSSYAKRVFGMFGGEEELVTLRVENRLSGVILDRFGHDSTFFRDGDGHFTVRVRVSVSPQFLGWIMSFGRSLTIVGPDSVVERYHALAKEILE